MAVVCSLRRVLQGVAVCCSVLQCAGDAGCCRDTKMAVVCSLSHELQCVAACCGAFQCVAQTRRCVRFTSSVAACCSVSRCIAVCCSGTHIVVLCSLRCVLQWKKNEVNIH